MFKEWFVHWHLSFRAELTKIDGCPRAPVLCFRGIMADLFDAIKKFIVKAL